jgi:hypothetical protein
MRTRNTRVLYRQLTDEELRTALPSGRPKDKKWFLWMGFAIHKLQIFFVAAQPCWVGSIEALPLGAWKEIGASFENALRFQNSQKYF